jgi:glutamate synthase domain-containing protein 3
VNEKIKIHEKDVTSNLGWQHFKEQVTVKDGTARVDAGGMHYRDLNALTKALSEDGVRKVEIINVHGQRYLGTGLHRGIEIDVYGTPGNDLGAFMRETTVNVYGNAQDGCGNTMDNGKIIVHGHAGDIVGYSMRGGSIFIRDDAGYRVGIHMKEYQEKRPVIVVGGTAQDFLGEYMAGGVLVVLGLTLENGVKHTARFVGTGMHSGKIYVRGKMDNLSKDVEALELSEDDRKLLGSIVNEFCGYFGFEANRIMEHEFSKLVPVSNRPYGKLYVK